MFREFVDNKIKRETEQFTDAKKISKDVIIKSEVSDFTKNYLYFYLTKETTAEDVNAMINKANKLYFNYTLRPKWTLINFLFNNFESRSPTEILKKLKLFPFYKYYTDAVTDFINDNSMIFITKSEIENIIDRTNLAIHKKLTVDITGQKIKNVFLQLFILNDFDEDKYNLEAVIPFSFIKIFLSDKNYPDLLSKFDTLNGKNDHDNIELKDIIKVITDKFSEQDVPESVVSISEVEEQESIQNISKTSPEEPVNESSTDKSKDSKKIKLSSDPINKDNFPVSEKDSGNKIDKENGASDFKIKAVVKGKEEINEKKADEKIEKTKGFSEGFVIKQKIENPVLDSEAEDVENTEYLTSEESAALKSKPIEIPLEDTILEPQQDNKTSKNEFIKQKNIDFKELFSEKELDSILNRVYNSNLMARQRSFEKLNSYKTWFEAFNHLKEIFKNNKVDIYHKDVIRYVDALNEHFQDKE